MREQRPESVWDYPRPPRLERSDRFIRVEFGGIIVAGSNCAFRVLETSHPPAYYFPPADVNLNCLEPAAGASYCEWKGVATYFSVVASGRRAEHAAWTYEQPTAAFAAIAGFVAFYPSRVDSCYVDDEHVLAQPGDFYGGWITSDIRGPFKGARGTASW